MTTSRNATANRVRSAIAANPTATYAEIATLLGLSVSTVARRAPGRGVWANVTPVPPPSVPVAPTPVAPAHALGGDHRINPYLGETGSDAPFDSGEYLPTFDVNDSPPEVYVYDNGDWAAGGSHERYTIVVRQGPPPGADDDAGDSFFRITASHPDDPGWPINLVDDSCVTTGAGQRIPFSWLPEKLQRSVIDTARIPPLDSPKDHKMCEIILDGYDTNGDAYNRCTVHGELVLGDAPYCEGFRPT